MIYEYAVNPEIAAKNINLQILEPYFGFNFARFISSFPNSWCKEVLTKAVEYGDMNKARVTERLRILKEDKHAFRKSGRAYNPMKGWFDNAICATPSFFCIIDKNEGGVKIEDISSTHLKFNTSISWQVKKTICEMTTIFEDFFRVSKKIFIVDPYFDPYQPNCKKFFNYMFSILNSRPDKEEVTVKFCIGAGDKLPFSLGQEQKVYDETIKNISTGSFSNFSFIIKNQSDDMHPRYMFSEDTCYLADHSFSIQDDKTVNISLLDWDKYTAIKSQYFNE